MEGATVPWLILNDRKLSLDFKKCHNNSGDIQLTTLASGGHIFNAYMRLLGHMFSSRSFQYFTNILP